MDNMYDMSYGWVWNMDGLAIYLSMGMGNGDRRINYEITIFFLSRFPCLFTLLFLCPSFCHLSAGIFLPVVGILLKSFVCYLLGFNFYQIDYAERYIGFFIGSKINIWNNSQRYRDISITSKFV
jgi:hypothetical protein